METIKTFNLKEELSKLPAKPGVYLMHGKDNEVIYVGKAILLKNRVRQYFQSSKKKSLKIQKMIQQIAWFEYIVTDSELEALILECNLIKEYHPKYNTMLMDDKSYPFICVTVSEEYPRVFMARQMKKDKNRYFGPYTSSMAVRETLDLLGKLYPYRTCNRVLPRDIGKKRPCLNKDMGRCLGPCDGSVSKEDYGKPIQQILDFLGGKYKELLKTLENEMQKASEALEFEEAIRIRELIRAVSHIAQKQKITDTNDSDDRDIIGLARYDQDCIVQMFFVRNGKILGRDHFHLEIDATEETREILGSFLKQFYSGTPFVPKEILISEAVADQELIADYLTKLRGNKVSFVIPKIGTKERLLELANKNAEMILEKDKEKIKREELRTKGAVRMLSEILGLQSLSRMEAFDISNISGFESVGSMVVFKDGRALKSDYRKFRIKTVSGPNDYASMEEVLTRRFLHGRESMSLGKQDSFSSFPDLILMDGGKGQVHIAEKVLEELNLQIPVCGMVKDDHHNTRGLYMHDQEIPIDPHSEAFHLITRIQDEAHRFAIEYHRSLRNKRGIRSVLSEIPGIGPKREKALIRSFENIDAIKNAEIEEIEKIREFNRKAAEDLYNYFHPGNT